MVLPGIKANTSPTDFYPHPVRAPCPLQGRELGSVRRNYLERELEPVAQTPSSAAGSLRRPQSHRSKKMTTGHRQVRAHQVAAGLRAGAEAIERKILAGRLKPGDPVGTESELVKQFGVNRSTVREGIRLLEQSGLVSREPSRRLSVAVAALPPSRHPHDPRADPAAGDVPRAVAHLARAGARRRRSGHGQRHRRGPRLLAANVDRTRKLAARSGRRGRARRASSTS